MKKNNISSPVVISQKETLGDSIKSGFGFGVGIEAAKSIFNNVFKDKEPIPYSDNIKINQCDLIKNLYEKCKKETPYDCNQIEEIYKICQNKS